MGFGNLATPYVENPFAGWIFNVHWKNRSAECIGETTVTGFWGTNNDNLHEEGISGGGGGGLVYLLFDSHGFFGGVWNTTAACNTLYTIASEATLAGTDDTETNLVSGVLTPGQSFIVGITEPGY